VNPLGFQVTGYRRDAEAPPPIAEVRPLVSHLPLPAPAAVVRIVQPPAAPAPAVSDRALSPSGRVLRERPRPAAPEVRTTRTPLSQREVPLSNVPLGSPLTAPGSPAVAALSPRP
jgi:type IV secretion system protein VirB8